MNKIMIYEQFLKKLFNKEEDKKESKTGVGYDVLGNKLEKAPDIKTQTFEDKYVLGTKKVNISEADEKQLTSKGWKKVWVETIDKTKPKQEPKDLVNNVELKFNKNNYFELGGYLLNNEFRNALNFELDKILPIYDVKSIIIESSTDKTRLTPKLQQDMKSKGYSPDNAGLSKARSTEIKKFIMKRGFDDSKFEIKELSELGKEGGYDPEARYVKINFQVSQKEIEEKLDQGDVVSYFQKVNPKKLQRVPKTIFVFGKTCHTYE